MELVALHFFPFPHVFRGERYEGYSVAWPKPCLTCDRQCEASARPGLQLCSYGVNYQRFDDDLLVAGVIVLDYPYTSSARKKVLKRERGAAILRADIEAALNRTKQWDEALEAELRRRKDEIIADYRESRDYQAEIAQLLRPEMERALAQVHDYKQFVQQIIQNMNVILETRYPGRDLEEGLAAASHEEVAIYWAARLMDGKLDSYLYLMYPEKIHDEREWSRFRFHGLVTKYRKIYQRRIESRRLDLVLLGESRSDVVGNSRAISIIPHTFIDNAIKYAPEGTRVELAFLEKSGRILFSVGSFGPVIEADEQEKIFDVSYRGRAAIRWNSEGTGFGLASAQNVAKQIGTVIRVVQDDQPGPEATFWTTFSVELEAAEPSVS